MFCVLFFKEDERGKTQEEERGKEEERLRLVANETDETGCVVAGVGNESLMQRFAYIF
jgi:hypothetical protein